MELQFTWICLAYSWKIGLDALYKDVWLLLVTSHLLPFDLIPSILLTCFCIVLLSYSFSYWFEACSNFINPFGRPKFPLWLSLLFELPCFIEFITTTTLLVHIHVMYGNCWESILYCLAMLVNTLSSPKYNLDQIHQLLLTKL